MPPDAAATRCHIACGIPTLQGWEEVNNYDVFRDFGDGITQTDLDQAVERSGDAIESMREAGRAISYLGSEVFVDDSGTIMATMCRYDAESESDIRDHSDRGQLPVSDVYLRRTPVDARAPRAGVTPKAA